MMKWNPAPVTYIRVNVDASKRCFTWSTTIEFVGKDKRSVTVIQ